MLLKSIACSLTLFLIVNMAYPLYAAEKNQIKAVAFDFGSVVAQTNKQEIAQFIAQSLPISVSEALEVLKQIKEWSTAGKPESDFWIMYANSKKIVLPNQWLEKLDEVRLQATREIPGMVNLVKDLQRQGYQTALLSNILENKAEIKRKTGLYDLFHPILLSYAIGVKKPDPKAYEALLRELKLPPQAVLFIDNKELNIEAAKSLGIDAILFINKDQLVQELKKRGIEISQPVPNAGS